MITNYHDHVPVHRLNTPQIKLWLFGGDIRRRMASNLAKRYKAGCGVCAPTLYLIAYVAPNGSIRELQPPFKKYEMHEIANQPHTSNECQCAEFFDPEVGGPWRERGTDAHHPLCQFDRTSTTVFKKLFDKTPGRVIVGVDKDENPIFQKQDAPSVRPDEALRLRESLK